MTRPLVLLLLAITLSAAAEPPAADQGVWVQVDYFDREEGESRYYLARIAPADLAALASPTPPTLVKLSGVCWFRFNEAGEPYELLSFADEADTDTVYLATRLIERVNPQRLSPQAYLAAHPAEADAEEPEAEDDAEPAEAPASAPGPAVPGAPAPRRKRSPDDL